MEPTQYLVYAMGIVALITYASSFQCKKRSTLLILQTISLLLFIGQYFVLKAYTGVILEVVCIVRNFVYFFKDKTKSKVLDSIATPIVFAVAAIVVGIFTYNGQWFCILPVIANIFQTVGLYLKKESYNRIMFLCASPLWLVYNLLTNTVFGVVTEIINIISIFISLALIYKHEGDFNKELKEDKEPKVKLNKHIHNEGM